MTLDKEARAKSKEDSSTKRPWNWRGRGRIFASEGTPPRKRYNGVQTEKARTLPTVRRGFLVRAKLINAQDAALAPAKQTNIEQDGITKRKSNEITNTSRIIRVDQASHQKGTLDDQARMYVPTLVKAGLGSVR